MKMAKTYKFILLTIAFFASIILSLGLYAPNVVKAQNVSASTYFNLNNTASENLVLENDKLVAKVEDGDVVSTINKLALDDFAVNFSFSKTQIKTFKINFTLNSFDANGNYNQTAVSYDKDIAFEIEIDVENNLVKYNGEETSGFSFGEDYTIKLLSNNNFIEAELNGTKLNVPNGDYYKIKDYDKVVSNLSFTAKDFVDGVTTADVNFNYFDQMATNLSGEYKQTFALNLEGGFNSLASPVISLYEGFNNGSNNVRCGKELTVNPIAYSLLEKIDATKLALVSTDENVEVWGQKIAFNEEGTKTFYIKSADKTITYATKVVNVIEEDTEAPVYNTSITKDSSIWKSFNTALQNSIIKEDGKHISTGNNEYLELPSLENFVTDNLDGFSSLTPIIYYNSPSSASTQNVTGTKLPIKTAGKYEFFVVFKDKSGNAMDKDSFYTVNEDEKKYNEYSNFIFTFELVDDADIIITAKSVGSGFVGVEYIAPGFTITASSYTEEYKLWYRKDAQSEWVNIPKSSSITDESYNVDGFTYNDIKNIKYDGEFKFTPNKEGEYQIRCYVTSVNSYRSAEGETAAIIIKNPTKVVIPHNPWLENNIWSVVFLGVGTLCLIGIIVLLCIKPKEEK